MPTPQNTSDDAQPSDNIQNYQLSYKFDRNI